MPYASNDRQRAKYEAEIERLRAPFRACDEEDWQYLASVIPDGGRGRFWKAVLREVRGALFVQPSLQARENERHTNQ